MSNPARRVFNDRLWQELDDLVQSKDVVVDRPAGNVHPRYPDLVYPLDYRHLDQTQAMDGGGVDVQGGELAPGSVTGVLATVDLFKNSAELKTLAGCMPEEMTIIEAHRNGQAQSGFLVVRASKKESYPE